MDLLSDLNIIAVPPPSSNTGGGESSSNGLIGVRRRKKKNNKYERRRQKAQRAKQQQQQEQKDDNNERSTKQNRSKRQQQQDKNGQRQEKSDGEKSQDTSLMDNVSSTDQHSTLDDVPKTNQKKDDPVDDNVDYDDDHEDDDDNDENVVVTKDNQRPSEIKSQKQTPQTSKDHGLSSDDNQNDGEEDNDDDDKHDGGDKDDDDDDDDNDNDHNHHQQQNNNNKHHHNHQDHAEYLAEFHARPMELDRRSGARATTSTIVSKSSRHLFEDTTTMNPAAVIPKRNTDSDDDDGNGEEHKHSRKSNNSMNPWEALGLHPRLVQTITGRSKSHDDTNPQKHHLSKSNNTFRLAQPTIIQSKTIRAVLSSTQSSSSSTHTKNNNNNKMNLAIHSETGSGKTLAYLLPILQSIAYGSSSFTTASSSAAAMSNPPNTSSSTQPPSKKLSRSEMGCRCIILCPTRELASQTLDVVETLCRTNFAGWIVPGGLLGGDSRQAEKSRLRKGLAVVVATPGRLLDHLHKTQSLVMSLKGGKLEWLVLDECDRLLDMGLGDQIKQIVQIIRANDNNNGSKVVSSLSSSRPSWRTVLVSATVTPSVKALANERMLCGDEQEWQWIKGSSQWDKKKKNNRPSHGNVDDEIESRNGPDDDNDEQMNIYSESTPRQLTQFHITVTAKLRLSTLVAFLAQRIHKGERTVVFMGTCACVDYHYALFQAMEKSIWDSTPSQDELDDSTANTKEGIFGTKGQLFKLHGNVAHSKRHQTMKQFNATRLDADNNGQTKVPPAVLLTTDVAARGLNLEGVDWTVQYDPPCEINDYVHRAGRTARAGKAGHSLLFLLPSEQNYLEVLKAKGVTTLTPLSLSRLLNDAASLCSNVTEAGLYQQGGGTSTKNGGDRRSSGSNGPLKSSRAGEYFSAEIQRLLEECVTRDDSETRKNFKEAMKLERKRKHRKDDSSLPKRKEGQLLELARDAFLSFLRAYSTKREQAVRAIFSSRALHLGHVAKSFALKDPPKSLAAKGKSRRQQYEGEIKDEQSNLPKSLAFLEAQDATDEMQERILKELPIISDGGDDEADVGHIKNKKQKRFERDGGRSVSAKELLLANAAKMQSNLMDAM